jgi:Family of unknown function (DUF6056)
VTQPPAVSPARARQRFFAMLACTWGFFALMAWLSPVQGEDWSARYWIDKHGLAPDWLGRYLVDHHILGDVVALFIGAYDWLHVLLSPLVMLAFLLGILTHVRGRWPRPDDPGDALAFLLASALLWVGGARAGVTLFYRPYLALFVYGLTCVLWFTAVIRFAGERARAGGARALGLFVLGVCAGTSNHQIVAVLLIAVPLWLRHRRAAAAWMWVGYAGLVLGALLLFTDRPYLPLVNFGELGFEANSIRFFRTLAEGGRVILVCLAAELLMLVRSRFRDVPMPEVPGQHVSQLGWLFGVSLLISVLGLLSPRWGEPAMLAPTVLLAIGGVMVLGALARDPQARRVLWVFALVSHAVVVALAVPRYVRVHREFGARAATLARAARGSNVRIAPYSEVEQSFWFYGEDLGTSATRSMVSYAYGLAGVEFTRPFGTLETTAEHQFEAMWDGTRGEPLPTPDLVVARHLFDEAVQVARARGSAQRAELRITNLDWPERRGRPVIAARWTGGKVQLPVARPLPVDRMLRYRFLVSERNLGGRYPETYIVSDGSTLPLERESTRRMLFYRPTLAARYTLIRCNAAECVAIESTWSGV